MREHIARSLGAAIDSQFINTHAWALVDLQASGEIVKRGRRDYALVRDASKPAEALVPAPSADVLPSWAMKMIGRANRCNGHTVPLFSRADLVALWEECEGKCAVTKLPFSFALEGSSLVKRAYAPSLDRIQAGGRYSRANCRLVMVAVNFAMNSWGLDVYLKLASAAVKAQPG